TSTNRLERRILRHNIACNNPITIDGEDSEDVKTFTYLGSIIDERGGCDADVKARIDKARAVYLQLKNIWNSKQQPTLRSGFSIQVSRQFYCMGQKPGELRKPSSKKMQVFANSCSREILRIRQYQQQPTVGEDKTDSRGGRNQEDELETDGTHIEESA
ncbi:unnamed protein product, partial [Schistosoma mattheei]